MFIFIENRFAPVISGAQSMSALNAQRAASARLPPTGSMSNTFGRGSARWSRRKMLQQQQQQRSKYSASASELIKVCKL